ncbi:MAG: 30S ribosomal protein S5 [Nanoarchaeota archaeon]|nr:30S ribosomal protein S5 [Nanoarchaeota archaeon]MBU0962693.1 30S ribosomal protein S5 [Nanoarchaeota archaeon]
MPEIKRTRAREKQQDPNKPVTEELVVEDVVEVKPEEEVSVEVERGITVIEREWKPKTELGKLVASGEITNMDQALSSSRPLLESEIVDQLMPNLESALLTIGQSKGKFGGGKRSIWKQTQKKTKEGNKPKFATCVVVGNRDGFVGLGYGKAKETMPAREKAIKNAKLNLISVKRGCGSWECGCNEFHTIPFSVSGKCGSVKIKLKPAPKGTGILAESQVKLILELAGIQDIRSKAFGQTRTKINLVRACFDALKNITKTKVKSI